MTGNPQPQPPKRGAWKLCAAAALAFVVTIGLWKGAQALLRGTEAPILADVPFSSAVYSSEGTLLRMEPASDGIYRIRTPLSDIPNALIRATLHYEDRRFWSHPGVDPAAVVRALWSTAFGGRRMGASTITMQVARLKLHLDTDTIPGKLRQMAEALRLELHHTKAQILEAFKIVFVVIACAYCQQRCHYRYHVFSFHNSVALEIRNLFSVSGCMCVPKRRRLRHLPMYGLRHLVHR